MDKEFKTVHFQRERREEMSKKYNADPREFVKKIREKYGAVVTGKTGEKKAG